MKLPALLIIATALLYSCAEKSSIENSPADSAEVTAGIHDHENIQLNNGQKWKVDPQMLVYIRNMEKDIESFDSSGVYGTLAENLQMNIDSLTSNCTMKGQAHDELHKWLLPYIETTEEFAEAEGQKASDILQKLRESFVTFNRYFE